ncbi:MAG: ABC transporter permease subunit [Anaerolineales bacterium]|nr:ABC transporter permease subunit [Anaerolineales bacterium]
MLSSSFWIGNAFWRDERFLRIAVQVVFVIAVIAAIWFAITTMLDALESRGLTPTFAFLSQEAGFPINETTFLEYDPSRSFGYAFLIGILNTLRVSILGVVLATILGIVVGVMRLSANWLISRIALVFIEFHRNIPLLVYLFIWFFAAGRGLPTVQESIILPGPIVLNQRGIYLAWPMLVEGGVLFLSVLGIGLIAAVVAWFALRYVETVAGTRTFKWLVSLAILIVTGVVGWFISGGQPLVIDVPVLGGFNYTGGLRLTPSFVALFVGLVLYTAAFIAEVVRAGIQAVNRGQVEAGLAIGLGTYQTLNLVVFPQALRVIIPPLISQYLNLAKNSSLAVAIGYFDVFFVGRTIINQAGRAIEVFLMIMAVYLIISLVTSLVLNWYNRRIQFATR